MKYRLCQDRSQASVLCFFEVFYVLTGEGLTPRRRRSVGWLVGLETDIHPGSGLDQVVEHVGVNA